tara:strand:- start:1139 stop:1390 length:252 start_codon:yes stop_codon:yes gene_type:complete
MLGDSWFAVAVGVAIRGKDPASIAPVRCANVSRSDSIPRRIIPERGKVGEASGKPSRGNKARAVFQEYKARSNLIDKAGHLNP